MRAAARQRRGSSDLGARDFRSCGAALTRPSGTLSHPAGGRGGTQPPPPRLPDCLLPTAHCPLPNPHFIVGIENSAPSLMPEGQRDVTVLVFV